jgi:hypothetical protein
MLTQSSAPSAEPKTTRPRQLWQWRLATLQVATTHDYDVPEQWLGDKANNLAGQSVTHTKDTSDGWHPIRRNTKQQHMMQQHMMQHCRISRQNATCII